MEGVSEPQTVQPISGCQKSPVPHESENEGEGGNGVLVLPSALQTQLCGWKEHLPN